MHNLSLKVNGRSSLSPDIIIDGKPAKVKKNSFGNYSINYSTEKEIVNIKIRKYLEISGNLWWLFSWLFFIISIFGIFEPRYDKRCIVIDADFDVKMDGDKTLEFAINNISENAKAITITGNAEIRENKNFFMIDKRCQKRLKIMRIAKWLTVVAIIGAIAAVIVALT